ncbi:MAG: HAMP domain-containing sensor histidine kinase [Saprospiraceae bacterium]
MLRDTALLVLSLALAAFLFLNLQEEESPAHKMETLRLSLNNHLQEDSITISQFDTNFTDQKKWQNISFISFGVELFENNRLVWWNEVAGQIPKLRDARPILIKIGHRDFVLRTELLDFKQFRFSPLSDSDTESLTTNNTLFFRGVTYGVSSIPNWQNLALIWGFTLAWLLAFCILVRRILKKQITPFAFRNATLFILLSRLLFSWPEAENVLQNISLFRKVSVDILFLSPMTLLLDATLVWLVMYFLKSLKGKSLVLKIKTPLLYFISALTLSVFFLYWNYLLKIATLGDKIHIDISDIILFDMSSILVIVGLIFHLISGFLVMYLLFQSAHLRSNRNAATYLIMLAGVLLTTPLFYIMQLDIHPILFYLFLVAVVLVMDVYAEMKEQKLTYLLWWMLLFCGYLAIGFFHYDNIKSKERREEFVDRTFLSSSISDFNVVKKVKNGLDTSAIFLTLGALEFPAKWDKSEIKDLFSSITTTPTDNFDIELFDNNGFSLFANHFGNYHQVKKNLQIAALVEGNNVYYHPLNNCYYVEYELLPEKHPNGPWLLVLTYKAQTIEENEISDLSYVLIKNDFIVDRKIDVYVSPSDAELLKVSSNGIKGAFIFAVRENNMGYKLVVFETKPGLLKSISIFSFLFALAGAILILLTWVNTKIQILPDSIPLKMTTRSSLKTKIQLSIIMLIIFSFIVVGSVTGFYFYNLIQANQNGKENEETQILANTVLQESKNKDNSSEVIDYFYHNLLNLSYIHGKNLQLYDDQGRLLATSTKTPLEYIMPFRAMKNSLVTIPKSKSTGYDFHHFDYIPLRDNQGSEAGYLGIQHQYTDISSKSIIDFLGTILNVYIFLFLIAGVIAITIANSITKPIAILAEKLKKFKLGKSNEFLQWQSNDEIGSLISEYNNLNEELTRSAEQLAKNERDMAWREMAKQVAHEIKNPLTPMKLSIQYLEKASKEDPERAQGMIPRVANTLIEQIDNLSQIAVEFSNFATMPQATNEKIALNDLVVAIHDLFRKRDDMDIALSMPIDDLVVFADKNHMVRILNNLVKNAIQAIPDGKRGKIDISLYVESQDAIICVSDNGIGIPQAMKSKVFAPNFTTKSSGTGLGLAISANMIESFNGKIYFESEENKGTQFYICIPLMKKDEREEPHRVSLDE